MVGASGGDVSFHTFHTRMLDNLESEYNTIVASSEEISPCLLKIEEFLFGSRSLR